MNRGELPWQTQENKVLAIQVHKIKGADMIRELAWYIESGRFTDIVKELEEKAGKSV